jgi:phosphatidylglycerophosphate synthase
MSIAADEIHVDNQFRDAVRAHTSLLAAPEKRCLVWIANRLPGWVNSDHLTALGFFGMFMVGASFAYARWDRMGMLWAIFWLGINWFGDSLDGTLARVRDQQRPKYGFYVDHVVDCFGATFVLAGLALSGVMNPFIAAGVLVAYLLLSIEIYLATYTLGTFHMSFWKFGPTEMRILLAIGSFHGFFNPTARLFGAPYLLFDVGGVISIAVLLAITAISVARHARELNRTETVTNRNTVSVL